MNEVERAYRELLLQAQSDDLLTALVKLHVPSETIAWTTYCWCTGCYGTVQGDPPAWPRECDTTLLIAKHLHVDMPS